MWTIFKVCIEFVIILLLFYILGVWPWGMWDLSSPTRDWTHTLHWQAKSSNVQSLPVLTTGPPGKSLSSLGHQFIRFWLQVSAPIQQVTFSFCWWFPLLLSSKTQLAIKFRIKIGKFIQAWLRLISQETDSQRLLELLYLLKVKHKMFIF